MWPTDRFLAPVIIVTLVCAVTAIRTAEPCIARVQFNNGRTSVRLSGVTRTENHLFVSVRINGNKEELRFIFDTGAGRTVLNRRAADRLGLHATEKSSFSGVGAGHVDVDVVKNASVQLG